ncbi:taste receptor type 1 member 1-like [Nelusetta ayraudi]|uniref:taste receptor type 1 member 1-like n=1 Tax=Nelusetta ayraudi TaxID=303726 RepID=UPI003F72221D
MRRIKDTEICLAYTAAVNDNSPYSFIYEQIEAQKIRVIIVFTPRLTAEALLESAIRLNVTDKIWIAGDTWSLNSRLPKQKGIKNVGTVLGVAQTVMTIPGFNDFTYAAINQTYCANDKHTFCNQVCNCSGLSAESLINSDPTYSFPVYAAIYAIAHALHHTLQCGADQCNGTIEVYPYMVLSELKKSNFTLLNQSIQFDKDGDPKFGSYDIVYWNQTGDAEDIGYYNFHPFVSFFINDSEIQWFSGEVPAARCSDQCKLGYAKKISGMQKCCFTCELCRGGTHVNITEDPYTCVPCKEAEWSAAGSTSCLLRAVEYVAFTDTESILIIIGACALVLLTVAMSVVFAINYNTPIVRSAGGPMCFLILGCLSLSSMSVFFYFGEPTSSFCTLRILPFVLFYTVCLACFAVRSFQIVFIFKIAAKIPKLHSWWMKYHGQWLVICVLFVVQAFLLVMSYSRTPPEPYRDVISYPDRIILTCDLHVRATTSSVVLLVTLCTICFVFSYMGKELPKNYNEAKSITFCLFLQILTWIIFATICILYSGKHILSLNALAILSSLYSFMFWYFLPKGYIIIFQPQKNTQKYFQSLIQNYTKTISQ